MLQLTMYNYFNSNGQLIDFLIQSGAIKSDRLEAAFRTIDRKNFLRSSDFHQAYINQAISIGHGSSNSQPYTVAFMLNLLDVQPGNTVLDIGSGSGWTTALLAYLTGADGNVIGLERINDLVNFGKTNLEKFGFKNAKIQKAKGNRLGLPNKQFDRILVSASAGSFPEEIIEQLKPGGILVIPVENSIWKIHKIDETELISERYEGFAFVPLVK